MVDAATRVAIEPAQCANMSPYGRLRRVITTADERLPAFKAIGGPFVAKTHTEPGCVLPAPSFSGQEAHWYKGYDNAVAL
jgi:hypothetical protein